MSHARCSNAGRYKGLVKPRCHGGNGCNACRKKFAEVNGGPPPANVGRSLRDFVRDKKREGCRICALPPDILEQVKSASVTKIPRATVIEWLKAELKTTFTSDEFDKHTSGRHQP